MNSSDVKNIRSQTGMSQTEFARCFHINLYTLRQWERKSSTLDSAVSAYLTCISVDAEIIRQLLGRQQAV